MKTAVQLAGRGSRKHSLFTQRGTVAAEKGNFSQPKTLPAALRDNRLRHCHIRWQLRWHLVVRGTQQVASDRKLDEFDGRALDDLLEHIGETSSDSVVFSKHPPIGAAPKAVADFFVERAFFSRSPWQRRSAREPTGNAGTGRCRMADPWRLTGKQDRKLGFVLALPVRRSERPSFNSAHPRFKVASHRSKNRTRTRKLGSFRFQIPYR